MSDKLESLDKELEDLRRRRSRLEADNFKNHIIPILNGSVGKAYVFRGNNYGGSGGRDGFWDTYRKLLAVSFSELHAWAIFEECQIDSEGRAKIEGTVQLIRCDDQAMPMLQDGRWKECSPKEYEDHRESVFLELGTGTALIAKMKKR